MSRHFVILSEVKVNVRPLCHRVRSESKCRAILLSNQKWNEMTRHIVIQSEINQERLVTRSHMFFRTMRQLHHLHFDFFAGLCHWWLAGVITLAKVQYVTTALNISWSSNHICSNSLFHVTNLEGIWTVWIQKYLAFQNNLSRSKSRIVQKSYRAHV